MLSIEEIKEKIKATTTCVELCILLSNLDIPSRVKVLSDPSGTEKLSEFIKTTNDVLELEKIPLDLELHKPLSALLTPIYSKALMSNIQETANTIQQDFSKVHLLSWLTYEDRNLVLEAFDPNLTITYSPLDSLLSCTITNRQLGSLLSYLDQSGHELALKKYQDKLPTLVQTFNDVLIFKDVSFDVWPESLRHICAKILITQPQEIAAIINSIRGRTPLLPALCYTINIRDLSRVLIHLNDPACTEMIEEVATFDLISDTYDMFILTKAFITHDRKDLFSNQALKDTCIYIIENAIDSIIADLEHSAIGDEFDYLFYSSFWLNGTKYNKIILTPLVEEGALVKIVKTDPQLSKLLSLNHLTQANRSIILNSLSNKLSKLSHKLATKHSAKLKKSLAEMIACHTQSSQNLDNNSCIVSQKTQDKSEVPAIPVLSQPILNSSDPDNSSAPDNLEQFYDTDEIAVIRTVCSIPSLSFFGHEIPLDWSDSEGDESEKEEDSRKRKRDEKAEEDGREDDKRFRKT